MIQEPGTSQRPATHFRHIKAQSCGNNAAFDCDATPSTQGIFAADTEAQTTVSVEVQGPIDPYRFNMFMADLLAERGSDIKRMSGVFCVQGYSNYGTYFKFEGSQNTVTFGPTTAAVAQDCNTASISVVSFTGHNLSQKDLKESLETCTWLPVAPGWTEHYTTGVQQPFYYHQATGRKQWQRPAAVESQSVTTPHAQVSQAPALSRQSCVSEVSDTSLEEVAIRSSLALRQEMGIRSAVSCPCNASDACAAVFDIRCKGEKRQTKRLREEDVSSKFADMDVRGSCSPAHLMDSASSLDAARTGQGRMLKKLSPVTLFKQDIQEAKQGLRRSSSCQLHVQKVKVPRHQLLELSH